jgi:HSP20 family protein
MTKTKRSFFERLTGAKDVEPEDYENPVPVYGDSEETNVPIQEEPQFVAPQFVAPMTSAQPQTPNWSTPAYPPLPQEEAQADDGSEGQLTIDVYQTETEIVIKSTIAGVKPEDLDVTINNDMVAIKGERKNEETVDTGNYYYQECYWGSFSRSVLLPVDVIPEKADASLKNGILTIRLPKADTTRTKKIQVRGF